MQRPNTPRVARSSIWIAFGLFAILCVLARGWLLRMQLLNPGYHRHAQCMGLAASIGMWIAMMAAMMLPSALPMVPTFSAVTARLEPGSSLLWVVGVFLTAYLVVWSIFGIGASILEWLLAQQDLIRESRFADPAFSAGLLALAGAYQWSGANNFCLRRCRTPLGFMLAHYAIGWRGASQLGLRHGAFCVGCCWALMLLAWVGGAMNLVWMLAMTAFLSIERLLGVRVWLMRASGLALLGAAVLISVAA